MQGHREHVHPPPEFLYVSLHPFERSRVGKSIDGWGAAGSGVVQFVMGNDFDVGATGFGRRRPGFLRAHAVVTEKPEAHRTPFQGGGLTRIVQIHARPGRPNALVAQPEDGVLDAVRTRVEDMVARQRRHVKSRAPEREQIPRIARGRGNVETAFPSAGGVGDLHLAGEHVGRGQNSARSIEETIWLGFIQDQVPDQHEVEGGTQEASELLIVYFLYTIYQRA